MPPITRYFVRRRNWRWSPGNEHTPRGWVCFPGPGHTVATFDFFDDAEHDWGKREAEVRRKFNPFECGPLPMVSSFPEPVFRDFLMDTGIEPPAVGLAWDEWWKANRDLLSDEQRARVWEAVDKVRFFEITEETADSEVHVVVDVHWDERSGMYVAELEGGVPVEACRDAQQAGVIALSQSQIRRLGIGAGIDTPFADCRPNHVSNPFTAGATRLLQLGRVPFSEVFTIPLDNTEDDELHADAFPQATLRKRNKQLAVLVLLLHSGDRPRPNNIGVPIKAFADWGRAQTEMVTMERAARAIINPLQIPHAQEWLLVSLRHGPIPVLQHLCRERGIAPPSHRESAMWWANHIAPLSEAERAPFWDAFYFVRFYSVVSVPFNG